MTDWISVEERMPKPEVSVLIATVDDGLSIAFWCSYIEWWYESPGHGKDPLDGDYYIAEDVTHWMPLPDPPSCADQQKGEDDE